MGRDRWFALGVIGTMLAGHRHRVAVPEDAMRLGAAGAGVTAWVGAIQSSLCCLLPLAVIVLGLGSGAFMGDSSLRTGKSA